MSMTILHPLHARHEHRPAGPDTPEFQPLAPGCQRRRWEVRGTVQGVGYRPFVHRVATELGLSGRVRNADGTVLIDVEGPVGALDAFEVRLRAEAPPLAVVTGLVQLPVLPGQAHAGFVVEESLARPATGPAARRDVPPDAGICDACLGELFDPANRRYRYPFINCVDCGPRATIIDDLPYDRERTAMAGFTLCRDCAAEYHDPADRRFHAEPVACPACGPQLAWWDGSMVADREDALSAAAACILAGGIVAVKGLGGFQFVCDATAPAAVALLRKRKHRPAKPLAVMVPDLAQVQSHARLSGSEVSILTGPARPIVLAEPRVGHAHTALVEGVRGSSPRLGIFLPTTPLHHLLLRAVGRPLVVTSGNLGGEPIIIDESADWGRLHQVADGILGHDRPIRAPYDDSVTALVADRPTVIRRARGYAPAPLALPVPTPKPVLAVGAQLKHTFTLARESAAITSAHTGDLENAAVYDAFTTGLDRLSRLHGVEPAYVAHDLHPGYLSTRYAHRFPSWQRIPVQHHHAHIASCAAEHDLTGDVIGIAYDGLGLGDDGTLWGGEVMVANLTGYTRLARFARAPLPGAAAAVKHPARMALGYLMGLEPLHGPGIDPDLVLAFTRRQNPADTETIRQMIARGVNCPVASSAGRLFDAASAILGLCRTATYEGEAAVALEHAAGRVAAAALPWRIVRVDDLWVYDPGPTLSALLEGVTSGTATAHLAAAFHQTIAEVTVDLADRAAGIVGTKPVCLSGGVWQNRRLTKTVVAALTSEGFDVYLNQRVPCNDGGISYGQAAVAAATLAGRIGAPAFRTEG